MMTVDQLNQEFESNLGPLKSYLLRITTSLADVEDIVHDTYLRAVDKLGTFRGESTLKTWFFTIASNLARDNNRVKQRWVENVTDIARAAALTDAHFFKEAMDLHHASPHGKFEIREHIVFCFTCISKSLPLEQQLCVFLKEVYEFKVQEIEGILGISEAMVKYHLHTGRQKMISVFDGRCALINKEGVCHQCSELNGIFNPKQSAQEELAKIALARELGNPDKELLFDLRTEILKELDPIHSEGAALQLHHLAFNRHVMEKYLEKEPA